MIALLAALAAATPSDRLYDTIMTSGCYAQRSPDGDMVRELLRIEQRAGFTGPARGLLVAAACNESGLTSHALGDWVNPMTGKRCRNGAAGCIPKSYGLLQFQGWAKRKIRAYATNPKIKDPRFDWRASAEFWTRHVVKQIPRVRAECGYTDERDVWRAAHRTAVTAPKCGRWKARRGRQVCVQWIPRCHKIGRDYRSRHWKILHEWQAIASKRYPTPRTASTH